MKIKNYPKIIYKYRDWTKPFHKDILLKNEIFMASPKDFNDPFDCRITVNYFLLNTPEKIEKYITHFFKKHNDWIIEEGLNIEIEKKSLRKRLQNINAFQKERERIEFKMMDEHFGIFSMSGKWNSILMWSHYGNFHKGFCIGYSEEKMRNSGLFGKGAPVTYLNKFPEINPLSEEHIMVKSFKQTHSKAKKWKYEKEYRLMNLYPEPPSNEKRTIVIPEKYIEEINLGVNISKDDREEIIGIAKKRCFRVYQLEIDNLKFKLKRIEL